MANSNVDPEEPDADHTCALCHQLIQRREGAKITGYHLHFSCAGELAQAIQKSTGEALARPAMYQCSMADLKDGEHIALIYEDEWQRQHAVSEFVRMGLERNRSTILICTEDESKKYTAYLRESGIDLAKLSASDESTILFNDELLQRPANMIFERLSREVKTFADSAREKGSKGINLWSEVCGILGARGRYKDCLLLERLWEEYVSRSVAADMPVKAVCTFTFIPPRVEVAMREFHSGTLVIDGTLKLTRLPYHL